MDAFIRIPATAFRGTLFRQIAGMIKGQHAALMIAVKENKLPVSKKEKMQYIEIGLIGQLNM